MKEKTMPGFNTVLYLMFALCWVSFSIAISGWCSIGVLVSAFFSGVCFCHWAFKDEIEGTPSDKDLF